MYGKCLLRVINMIVIWRECHPLKKTFLQKIDHKPAYLRYQLNWKTKVQTIMQALSNIISLIYLCLNFIGGDLPNGRIIIYEMDTNLDN